MQNKWKSYRSKTLTCLITISVTLLNGYFCYAQDVTVIDNLSATSLKAGDTITLYGTFVQTGNQVQIGNKIATIVNQGTNSITATIPTDIFQNSNPPTKVFTVRVYNDENATTTNTFLIQVRNFDTERLGFWGNNSSNLPIPITNITNVVQASLGKTHNVILNKDGSINLWGKLTIDLDSTSDTGQNNFDNLTADTTLTLNITCPTDALTTPTIQIFEKNNNANIGTATCINAQSTITTHTLDTGTHTIIAKYTSPNGTTDSSSLNIRIVPPGTEEEWVDRDSDGLIELYYIEDLDTVRQSLTGKHYGTRRKTKGCPNNICKGYELARTIDFTQTKHYKANTIPPQYRANTPCNTGNICGWIPIGTDTLGNLLSQYNAVFEGNYHSIKNIIMKTHNAPNDNDRKYDVSNRSIYIGLFGNTGGKAIIQNISLENTNIQLFPFASRTNSTLFLYGGILAGKSDSSKISYIHVQKGIIDVNYRQADNIYGRFLNLGGMIGWMDLNQDTLMHAYSTANVNPSQGGSGPFDYMAGGLLGYLQNGTVLRSYATGSVHVPFTGPVGSLGGAPVVGAGGLIGKATNGNIVQCYATGSILTRGDPTVQPNSFYAMGGLVGIMQGNVIQSFSSKNTVRLSSSANTNIQRSVGGLVGSSDGNVTIMGSYSTKNLVGDAGEGVIGGLIGERRNGSIAITSSYASPDRIANRKSFTKSGSIGGIQGSSGSTIASNVFWSKHTTFVDAYSPPHEDNPTSSVPINETKLNQGGTSLDLDSIRKECTTYNSAICTMGSGFEYSQGSTPKIAIGARVRINGVYFAANTKEKTELNNNSMVSHVFNSTDSTVRSTLTFGGVAFTADTAKITTITSPYTIENIENGLGILVEELESFLDFGKNPDNDYLDDFSYASTEAIKIPIVNNQRIDKIVNIAAGGNGTIALRNDGSLYVWGDTTYKQLVIPPHPTGSATITSLARGENHSMILTSQGQVISWGDNSYGQTTVPLTASTNIVAIAAGRYHSLALSATGNIIAWGNNNLGQTNVDTSRRYKAISAGENFSLAIDTQGNLHRWGTAVHNRTVNTQRNRYHQFLSSGYSHAFTVDTLKYINGLGSNVFKQLSIPTYLLNSYTWFVAAGANRSIALSSKRHQYITFTISNKTYGDIPFVLNANSTSDLEVSYSVSNTLISLNNNTVSIHGAGTVAITAYQTGNESYLSSPSVTQVLIIYKAGQSISFTELGQKTYGDAPFLLYASATSTLEATYSASNTLISFNNNTVSIHGAGTVAITAYQTGNDNYLSTSETQVLTIDKAVQSISFPALAQKKYEDAPFLLYASATSTLEVTYSVSNTLISLNNNTVSIHGAGTVEITANQTGNENYLPANIVQTLTIETPYVKIDPMLTFAPIGNKTVGDVFILSATSQSSAAISFISSDDAIIFITGNTATARSKGTATIIAQQEENTQYKTAILEQSITVVLPNSHPLTFIEKENPAIHIYPNPAKDYLTIKSAVQIEKYSLYRLDGTLVLGDKGVQINIQSLNKGEYMLILYGKKGEVLKSEKIIKN